jgi:hypothetical protein
MAAVVPILGLIIRNGVPVLAIIGLWFGLRRAGLLPRAHMTWIVTAVVLLVWYVTIDQLCRAGFYAAHWDVMRLLCWAIALAWLVPLTLSRNIGAALDAIPSWWLVGLQFYRALGGAVWFVIAASGRVPVEFAIERGIGDILVGILAVVAAVWLFSGRRGGWTLAVVWNVLGLLDFAAAILFASVTPYTLAYPLVMIPAFNSPLLVIFHGLSLRQLARAIRRPEVAPAH